MCVDNDKRPQWEWDILPLLESIDASLKTIVAAIPPQPGKLESLVILFGAAKSKT